MNTNQPKTELQTKPRQQGLTIRDRLESDEFKAAVAKALPRHLTPDRFIRVACTAIMRQPKLAQCDQTSFFNALLQLSQLGIEPDGRRAHLIPFENRKRGVTEVQLIIDYKGLAELVMRSGLVSNIHADVVCERDVFEYDRGELKRHTINFKEPRGTVYAVYCLVRFKDGSEKCDVLTVDEVEAVRSRSRAAKDGPWVTDWKEMAKKSAFRRLSKWLPLSPEFRDAIEADDDTTIDIATVPAFELDAKPKTKPVLAAPVKEQTAQPEQAPPPPDDDDINLNPPPEDLTETEPLPSAAKAEPSASLVQSADPGSPVEFTTELAAKLSSIGVSLENFEKWLIASGRVEAFIKSGKTASDALLADERSLKKLATLYGS